MALSEKELDRVLDKGFREDGDFLRLILTGTKFAEREAVYIWSRCDHPWGTIDFKSTDATTGEATTERKQGETDIVVVLKASNGEHLALHVENKIGSGKFTHNQPQMYAQRAAQWKGRPEYKNYTDFITVLIAPEIFRARYPEQAAMFDKYVSHESLAARLPEFASAGRNMTASP